jgi:methyltransferase (TIGR00027 family)
MKEGTASHTARSVAAHRLEYARAEAPYGDIAADDALARDVAGDLEPHRNRMHEYLRARTAFFDRAVVTALEAGTDQVVIGGAGYDGRALRYGRPGVRWFELDHPATQADKLERLARLNLDTGHIRFAAADFTADPIAAPLIAAGLDPARPALFLLEGVAVYLEQHVLERLLAAFREVAADGSTLAISLSTRADSPTRQRFEERVAEHGEPARSAFTPDTAADLLAAAGWEVTEGRERLRFAGLLSARPAAPRAAAISPDGLPLSALLSQLLVAFTIEADNEAEHRFAHGTTNYGRSPDAPASAPWLTSMLMWANCLRFLPDEGITLAELRRRARTETNLDGMRRWGYVTYTPDPGRGTRPRPDAIVRPTAAGSRARDAWRSATDEVERRWRHRFGAATIGALGRVVAGLDPALPDCLPILGYGLFSGRPEPEPAADPRSPAPADPAGLPLWALLSRVLLAFATEYERAPGPSLAVSANVLRVLTEGGVRTRDIPSLAGVSKESVAMAMGVLVKAGLAAAGPDPAGGRFPVTRLTAGGARAQRAYRRRIADIEVSLGDQDAIAALRAAACPLVSGDRPRLLEGLNPYPDNWRARVPPASVLPHYPMTLHRGGYPDGS